MAKLSHLLELINILQYKKFSTASELAHMLEVDKKTIYRYMDSLNMANIPVRAKKGRYGGFYIGDEYYMKPPALTDDEVQALLLSSEVLSKENGFIYAEDLKKAVSRIVNSSLNTQKELKSIRETLDFQVSKIGAFEDLKGGISKLNYAIKNDISIKISYFSISKNEQTTRVVDPYSLIYKKGFWYVIGYCHLRQEVRIFKVFRIKNIKVTEEKFKIQKKYSAKEYMKNSWNVFRGEETKVTIIFKKEAAGFIKETKWHENQQIEDFPNGDIAFTVYVNGTAEIKSWVMGFGNKAKVLEPASLKEEIKKEIEALNLIYSE
ncbi:MAG: transcriptional regulator [Clostridiaceae bacterium]